MSEESDRRTILEMTDCCTVKIRVSEDEKAYEEDHVRWVSLLLDNRAGSDATASRV